MSTAEKRDPTMGGQFALIPAKVLYDDDLPATAKLLYGEIYRLSHANGYCYASNADFIRILGCSEKTVRRLIAALADRGHVRVKMIRRYGTAGDIVQRRIFCGLELAAEDPPEDLPDALPEPQKSDSGGPVKNDRRSGQKCPDGPVKNDRDTDKENKYNNKPPIVPQGDQVEILFDRFWKAYPRRQAKKAAKKAWDKLKPDLPLCRIMAAALERQKRSSEWRRDGGAYIPYPATWLNGRRWEDEPGPEPPDGPPGGSDSGVVEEEGVTYI